MTDAHFIVMFEKISPLADVLSCRGVGPGRRAAEHAAEDRHFRSWHAAAGGAQGPGVLRGGRQQQLPGAGPGQPAALSVSPPRAACTATKGRSTAWIAAHPEAITVSASNLAQDTLGLLGRGKQIMRVPRLRNWTTWAGQARRLES